MATVKKSMIVEKFSGKLYGVVFNQYHHGVEVSRIPDMSNVKRSKDQKKCNSTFANAVAYAREIKHCGEKRKLFLEWLSAVPRVRRGSEYHMAIRYYYKFIVPTLDLKTPSDSFPFSTE
jgi:hypothetical protein